MAAGRGSGRPWTAIVCPILDHVMRGFYETAELGVGDRAGPDGCLGARSTPRVGWCSRSAGGEHRKCAVASGHLRGRTDWLLRSVSKTTVFVCFRRQDAV